MAVVLVPAGNPGRPVPVAAFGLLTLAEHASGTVEVGDLVIMILNWGPCED